MTIMNTNNLKFNQQPNRNKIYERDFLIKLRDTPQSQIKPTYLTEFKSIKKNFYVCNFNSKPHHKLFSELAKPSGFPLFQFEKRSSFQANPTRSRIPDMIHLSLSLNEAIKLHESTNAWKPTPLKNNKTAKDDEKTQLLYKKVRSVLNKLTPEKFDKLVEQVRELEIDTQEKLQGVINLVFDKAIDEPNFAKAYVMMCSELALMKVDVSTDETTSCSNINFRKLLITRCQKEFEKNKTDETNRVEKLKEIEECTDADKKKELKLSLEEHDRRIRMKSVGNIKFIGELYKQRMLTNNIMNLCVNHLLKTPDEENLECLCKLLTTIGEIFEEKNDLSPYFTTLTELINQNRKDKISSRIRFMIQDVIDLRQNSWVPRCNNNNNPKSMVQIQKEIETEQIINSHLNASFNPPQDLHFTNKKNSVGPTDGWNVVISKTKQSYSTETSKFKLNQVLDQLLNFMFENNSFDSITDYITTNFGKQILEPKFCRCLITAILKISIATQNGSCKLNSEKFKQLLPLVTRYTDADPQRELEVLIGIQHFIHNLWHPQGLLGSIIKIIYDNSIISDKAFLLWQNYSNPADLEGHAVVIKSLTSFFVNLLEFDDNSEESE
ncbi:eukaryotic translation initiation factor 4 gamma 3 isoform X2 [Microplitis demolitor]|uniref:eukaryotic translation initiation factor 4 gamma 3 isoform X2 n=1 Tax=Microplitis demolitor TaxID=69319 RepID=UPI0004CDD7B1|nr:eukaryotic translation initiation factor 4 gamma 3 isoform X2 [Microplitis demolitor]